MKLYKGESLAVQNTYIIIAEFFGTYALKVGLYYTKKIIKTAQGYNYWQDNPGNVLYFFEKLEGLVMAALLIHREEGKRQAAVLSFAEVEAPSVAAYEQYCGWHYKSAPWNFFPRHLSSKEYGNPYKVFEAIAAKGGRRRWRYLLNELLHYTLSTSLLTENDDDFDGLTLYLLLSKLLEAAQLIDIRAINEIGGEPRLKWKGLPTQEATSNTGHEYLLTTLQFGRATRRTALSLNRKDCKGNADATALFIKLPHRYAPG